MEYSVSYFDREKTKTPLIFYNGKFESTIFVVGEQEPGMGYFR